MPYCPNCGAEVANGSTCAKCAPGGAANRRAEALSQAAHYETEAARLKRARKTNAIAGLVVVALYLGLVIDHGVFLPDLSNAGGAGSAFGEIASSLSVILPPAIGLFFAPWGVRALWVALFSGSVLTLNLILAIGIFAIGLMFAVATGWVCFLYQWWKIRKAEKEAGRWRSIAEANL